MVNLSFGPNRFFKGCVVFTEIMKFPIQQTEMSDEIFKG